MSTSLTRLLYFGIGWSCGFVWSGPNGGAYGLAVSLGIGLARVLFRELYLCLNWVRGDTFGGVDRVCIVLCHWCVWRWCACYCSRLQLVHSSYLVHQLPCVVLGQIGMQIYLFLMIASVMGSINLALTTSFLLLLQIFASWIWFSVGLGCWGNFVHWHLRASYLQMSIPWQGVE